jgi:hypothetical protein
MTSCCSQSLFNFIYNKREQQNKKKRRKREEKQVLVTPLIDYGLKRWQPISNFTCSKETQKKGYLRIVIYDVDITVVRNGFIDVYNHLLSFCFPSYNYPTFQLEVLDLMRMEDDKQCVVLMPKRLWEPMKMAMFTMFFQPHSYNRRRKGKFLNLPITPMLIKMYATDANAKTAHVQMWFFMRIVFSWLCRVTGRMEQTDLYDVLLATNSPYFGVYTRLYLLLERMFAFCDRDINMFNQGMFDSGFYMMIMNYIIFHKLDRVHYNFFYTLRDVIEYIDKERYPLIHQLINTVDFNFTASEWTFLSQYVPDTAALTHEICNLVVDEAIDHDTALSLLTLLSYSKYKVRNGSEHHTKPEAGYITSPVEGIFVFDDYCKPVASLASKKPKIQVVITVNDSVMMDHFITILEQHLIASHQDLPLNIIVDKTKYCFNDDYSLPIYLSEKKIFTFDEIFFLPF